MKSITYQHWDVFTDRRFSGNQLAVFLDPGDLDPGTMQALAGELAFSETTFVFPPEGNALAKVRIFTPRAELPLAGHPTVGSTFALVDAGRIPAGTESVTLELGVGPILVELEWEGSGLRFAWMRQPNPEFGTEIHDRDGVADALGLSPGDLDSGHIQEVSSGTPLVFVPLASEAAVDRAVLDRSHWQSVCTHAGLEERPVFLFARSEHPAASVHSRMFAPVLGIPEDAATGVASGPLGAYLVRYGWEDGTRTIVSRQGVTMGRPSWIHVLVDHDGDAVRGVRVGGRAVKVGTGTVL